MEKWRIPGTRAYCCGAGAREGEAREGEAPAEPAPRETLPYYLLFAGSRLGRSLALPAVTPHPIAQRYSRA